MENKIQSKKIFVSGNFNILHSGHLRLFKYAKTLGYKLYVGVFSDKILGPKAYIDQSLRLDSLENCSLVDKVILISSSLSHTILKLKPDIIVKGKEHELLYNEEEKIISKYGGHLIFNSGDTAYSSSLLIKKEINLEKTEQNSYSDNFLNRHNLKKDDLINTIHKFKELKVIVIGDLIVDEYISCQPLGMSNEEPVLVISPQEEKKFIGGAGIVAAHASRLGAEVDLISIAGRDDCYSFCLEELDKNNVKHNIITEDSRPTTLKQRFRCENKTLLKVSKIQPNSASIESQEKIYQVLNEKIKDTDLIIFSDFNYGCLPDTLLKRLIDLAKLNKCIISADCQSSSQIGDIGKYKNVDLITPTEKEARISTKNQQDGLVVIANKLFERSNADYILMKLGAEGLLINLAKKSKSKIITDKVSSLNSNPVDVAGAGDSMLVASSLSLACGSNIWLASLIGMFMASIQVGQLGNLPIDQKQLIREIKNQII
jgi:rfaE bifunctional protein kinase chain/domain